MTTKTEKTENGGFPTAKLLSMADYWGNIAHLWRRNPEPEAKQLRSDMLRNEKTVRVALEQHEAMRRERDELQVLCTELQEQLQAMMDASTAG